MGPIGPIFRHTQMAYCIKLAMYLPLLHIHYNPYVIGPVTYFLGLGSIFFPKTNAGCGICSNRPSSKHVATTASCQDLQATPSGNVAGSPLLSSIFIEVHRERGDFPPRLRKTEGVRGIFLEIHVWIYTRGSNQPLR